jgi:hypothetical protein
LLGSIIELASTLDDQDGLPARPALAGGTADIICNYTALATLSLLPPSSVHQAPVPNYPHPLLARQTPSICRFLVDKSADICAQDG